MWQLLLDNQSISFTVLFIVITCLSSAIFFLLKRIKHNNEALEIEKEKRQKRQEGLRESIRIISMATIQEQCETSEACLRLANLIPLYEKVDPKEDQWQPLFSMFQEIRGLKTMGARNELKVKARHKEDQIRFKAEEKYHSEILEICQKLYAMTKVES